MVNDGDYSLRKLAVLLVSVGIFAYIYDHINDGYGTPHKLVPGDGCYDANSPLPSHNIGTDSCIEYETGKPIKL